MVSDFWLRDLFTNRKQFVDIKGKKSELKDMHIGVIQGSVLGGPLFTYFINDLAKAISVAVPQKFVDDSNMAYFDKVENAQKLVKVIEGKLVKISEWVEKMP